LKVGERVKLIGSRMSGIYDVLEVRPGAFRTAFNLTPDTNSAPVVSGPQDEALLSAVSPASGQVFVYGREVKDFRSVDYQAIAMLNVSATQELAKRLEQKSDEVAALEKQLTDLKKMVTQLAADAKNGKMAADSGIPNSPAKASKPLTTASLDH
jgi:hypothetical protein